MENATLQYKPQETRSITKLLTYKVTKSQVKQLYCVYVVKESPQKVLERETTAFLKKSYLETLEKTLGRVLAICNSIGISRGTYYNWINNDPEFKKAVDTIKISRLEDIEDAMCLRAVKGDVSAGKYILKYNHLKYKEKQKIKKESNVHIYYHTTPDDELPTITLKQVLDDPILYESFMQYVEKHPDYQYRGGHRLSSIKITPEEIKKFRKMLKEQDENKKESFRPAKEPAESFDS